MKYNKPSIMLSDIYRYRFFSPFRSYHHIDHVCMSTICQGSLLFMQND